jgi:hypothetical protein
MAPSVSTALNAAFYGTEAPTFVPVRGRRALIVLCGISLGALVTLWLVLRFDVGDIGTIVLSYVAMFGLMHVFGFLAHLFGLAGETASDEN